MLVKCINIVMWIRECEKSTTTFFILIPFFPFRLLKTLYQFICFHPWKLPSTYIDTSLKCVALLGVQFKQEIFYTIHWRVVNYILYLILLYHSGTCIIYQVNNQFRTDPCKSRAVHIIYIFSDIIYLKYIEHKQYFKMRIQNNSKTHYLGCSLQNISNIFMKYKTNKKLSPRYDSTSFPSTVLWICW